MKRVDAIVRPFRLEEIVLRLRLIGVTASAIEHRARRDITSLSS
jgi:nitrogen regulatory protein PII